MKLFTFLLFLLPVVSLGGQDTLVWLPTAEVGSRAFSPYLSGWEADSNDLARFSGQELGSLLEIGSGLLIRAYSPGGLKTPAARGGASRHTAVSWNGVNLQSPLNGTLDLSLFPLEFLESVAYSSGGTSTLDGSGSLGGTIRLQARATGVKGFQAGAGWSAGSFGLQRPFMHLHYGTDHYQGRLRGLWSQSRNDFQIEGNERQENGGRKEWVLSQENELNLNANNVLRTYLWMQTADRELPPSLISANRNEYQADSILRIGLEWENRGNVRVDRFRLFHLFESTIYGSDLVAPANNRAQSWVGQYQHMQQLVAGWQWHAGLQWRTDHVQGDNLIAATRHQLDLYSSGKWQMGSWNAELGVRVPMADGQWYVPAAHLGVGRMIGSYWSFQAGSSLNFNLPGGNDLYWSDGQAAGNPNLLPERSWEQELAIRRRSVKTGWTSGFELRAFHRRVSNWILWYNQPGSTAFSPENLRSVRAYGLELRLQLQKKMKKHDFGGDITGSFGNARLLENPLNPAVEGNQVPHQPKWLSQGMLWYAYRNIRVQYQHQFTGTRFDGLANSPSEILESRHWARLEVFGQFQTGSLHWDCFLRMNNVWNSYTELFRYFPVPGRHFQLGGYISWL